VMESVFIIFIIGTAPDTPTSINNNAGVTKIPMKLPNAELKIAPASLPPIDFVMITADETGGGIQATTKIPRKRYSFILDVDFKM